MKRFNTAAMVIGKIMEVLGWLASAAMIVVLIVTFTDADGVRELLVSNPLDLTTQGFTMEGVGSNPANCLASLRIFAAVAFVIMTLFAMVFRNVYLIFKTANGKTSFSEGETPFQKNITRMVREIGIFYMSIAVVGFIASIIARAVTGVECYAEYYNLITGFVVLCFSQFFAYGTQLQKQDDGLL